ncbi:MAG: DNA (cytosine-5-)-methyltransferase, partial [Caldicoprobacterales bacterium]
LLMENVKALIFKKFKPGFEKWLRVLEELGYTNYWQVLNAKDYGIPQNRERVFVVSILGEHEPYEFPKPVELKLRLKDVLEDEVDERFYINNEKAAKLIEQLIEGGKLESNRSTFIAKNMSSKHRQPSMKPSDTSCSLLARDYKGLDNYGSNIVVEKAERLGDLYDKKDRKHQTESVWNKEKIAPTLDTMQGGNREPMIVASRGRNPNNPSDRTPGSPTEQRLEVNKQGISNTITSVQKDNYVLEPKIQKVGNIYPSKGQNGEIYQVDGISPTLRSGQGLTGSGIGSNNSPKIIEPSCIKHTELPCIFDDRDKGFGVKTQDICPTQRAERNGIKCIGVDYRIRKLTPKECWRLMGISDEDFEKAQEVNSNTQLYKQAGNAIVVDVLEGIFRKLFLSKSKEKGNKLEEQLEWLDDLLGVES